jgi:hypothetical protein
MLAKKCAAQRGDTQYQLSLCRLLLCVVSFAYNKLHAQRPSLLRQVFSYICKKFTQRNRLTSFNIWSFYLFLIKCINIFLLKISHL